MIIVVAGVIALVLDIIVIVDCMTRMLMTKTVSIAA